MADVADCKFVSRIRGKRDVHTMSVSQFCELVEARKGRADFTLQEYLTAGMLVRPFFDWDAKLEKKPSPDALRKMGDEHLQQLKTIVERVHPGAHVEYAQRHGPVSDPSGRYEYKLSFRAYVQGLKICYTDIPTLVRRVLGLGPQGVHPHLDLSVYKPKQQLLGVIYGCKDIDVIKRHLIPLDTTAPLGSFLVQSVGAEDVLVSVPAERGQRVEPAAGIASEDTVLHTPEKVAFLSACSAFFGRMYLLQEPFKDVKVISEAQTLVVTTDERYCDIARRKHQGNHPYISIGPSGGRLKCHDEECKSKDELPLVLFNDLPEIIREYHQANAVVVTKSLEVSRRKTKKHEPREASVALSTFSDAMNKEMSGKEGHWVVEGPKGRKNSSREHHLMWKDAIQQCLRIDSYEHDHPGSCRLCVYHNDNRRVILDCPVHGQLDVTAAHPRVIEIHGRYLQEVKVSGKVDVNVHKERDTILKRLINDMYAVASEKMLARDRSHVFYPLRDDKGELIPCCFIRGDTHEAFVQATFSGDEDYRADPIRQKKLEDSLRVTADPAMPFIKRDWRYIGFKNGLLCISPERKFTLWEHVDETTRDTVIVRNYLDMPLDPSSLETPSWDALVGKQIREPEIRDYLAAFFGRLLFPVGTDSHEVLMYLHGKAKTGKSTIFEAIKKVMGTDNVAVINGGGETTFGLQEKDEKGLIAIPDMPPDINSTLPGSTWQDMMSGSSVDVRVKKAASHTTEWKVPMLALGNRWPDWPNTGASVSRRLAIFTFNSAVMKGDGSVKRNILDKELPAIAYKAVGLYHELLLGKLDSGRKMFGDNCPEYFHKTRRLYECATDDLMNFFNARPEDLSVQLDDERTLVYGLQLKEDARTEWLNLVPVYELWLKNTKRMKRSGAFTQQLGIWDTLGCNIVEKMKVIKPCPDAVCHHKGTIVKSHGKWKRDVVLGLELTKKIVVSQANGDGASDDDFDL